MLGSPVETSLEDRVQYTRRRLMTAFTYDAVLVAMSTADDATLRALEQDYAFLPGPVHTLRHRLAKAHLWAVRAKVLMSTGKVTPDVVAQWARTGLLASLEGTTDFDSRLGGQFRLQPSEVDGGVQVAVSTLLGHDPRQFLIVTSVEERQQ